MLTRAHILGTALSGIAAAAALLPVLTRQTRNKVRLTARRRDQRPRHYTGNKRGPQC